MRYYVYEIGEQKVTYPVFNDILWEYAPFSFGKKTLLLTIVPQFRQHMKLYLEFDILPSENRLYHTFVDDAVKEYNLDKFVVFLLFVRYFHGRRHSLERNITWMIHEYIQSSDCCDRINQFIAKMDFFINAQNEQFIPRFDCKNITKNIK